MTGSVWLFTEEDQNNFIIHKSYIWDFPSLFEGGEKELIDNLISKH